MGTLKDVPINPHEQKLFQRLLETAHIRELTVDFDDEDDDEYYSGKISEARINWQNRGGKHLCFLEITLPNNERYSPEVTEPIRIALQRWVDKLKDEKLVGKTLLQKITKWCK